MEPGQFFVLVRNAAKFAERYPGVTLRGVYTGRLDNGGEKLALAHPLGSEVLSLTYGDHVPWPIASDGQRLLACAGESERKPRSR